jgi:hypothetical protein
LLGAFLQRVRRVLGGGSDWHRVELVRDANVEGTPVRGAPVAIQCVEDPFYLAVFSALRQQGGVDPRDVHLVITRSMVSGTIGRGWWYRFLHTATFGRFAAGRWRRAYSIVGRRVAYRSFMLSDMVLGIGDWFRSKRIARTLGDRGDFSSLEVLGVTVGDLIIDSYLRFRPAPRIEARDPFFVGLLWQAHRDIRRARRFFRKIRPRMYITGYSTYVDHGVPVRVALEQGVPVRSFGNLTQVGKPLTQDHWFHTQDTSGYRRDFAALPDPAAAREAARKQLATRLAGGIDPATSYMRVSAYAASSSPPPAEVRGAAVMFLHDFFDSPHVYADLVFPDFWSWVRCTIETLQAARQPFFIKPHPNQIELSSHVIRELEQAYPDVRFLPVSATSVQLAEAGMICGITVYGTVAHELAFLGVPTITCARHPHYTFDFCRTARTRVEYEEFLRDPGKRPVPTDELKSQALEFYYMHNLHGEEESMDLRRRFVEARRILIAATAADEDVLRVTRELHACRALAGLLSPGNRS